MKRPSLTFYALLFFLLVVFDVFWPALAALALALIGSIMLRHLGFQRFLLTAPPSNAAVLVTGTSTGFGRVFVQCLARQGILVFAGVRKLSDGVSLQEQEPEASRSNIVPIILDVTKLDDISASVKQVGEILAKRNKRLFALINNAGIQVGGPLETLEVSQVRQAYDVNVFGVWSVTKAFLPLLREFPGEPRLVIIGSCAGLIVPPMIGAYASTKHAVEALGDMFRNELSFPVITLEPGSYATAIAFQLENQLKQHKGLSDFVKYFVNVKHPPPEALAHHLEYALFSRFPPARMVTGLDGFASVLCLYIPDSVLTLIFKLVQKFTISANETSEVQPSSKQKAQ